MDDTIFRADAIALASGGCHPANLAEELAKLPSAQRWIPCSERLPEKDDRYLVTVLLYFDEYPYVSVSSFAHDLESVDKYGFEGRKRAGWYNYDDEYGYLERDGVVAWMPLPEPYEPPKEET